MTSPQAGLKNSMAPGLDSTEMVSFSDAPLLNLSDHSLSLVEGQNLVLEQIAQGQPLAEVLSSLARIIEQHSDTTTFCSFLLFDPAENRLRHGAAPSLPDEYCKLIDGVKIGPNVGSCGTAAYYTASIIVEDINTDPRWDDFRAIAQRFNLQACWSTPILNCDDRILATFAMYHPFPYKPTAPDRELVIKATYLARIAIEREETEIALKAANESLEQKVEQRTKALQTAVSQLQEQIKERAKAEAKLRTQTKVLENTLDELRHSQAQVIQSEKMSSLGQLVAGVAHEINNPVGFIHGNVAHLREESGLLLESIDIYERCLNRHPEVIDDETRELLDELDLDFVKHDLPKVLDSIGIGTARIRDIVLSLRTFSRTDEAACKSTNLHEGIDSTIAILQHRLKASPGRAEITIEKHYGTLPNVECFPGQLNQVFMNILSNAIDAIEDAIDQYPDEVDRARITISTGLDADNLVNISITDRGLGIKTDCQTQVFNPFFTTKAVGKGTGLGMSISYQIVTERHNGLLTLESVPNQGTTFHIQIPLQQCSAIR